VTGQLRSELLKQRSTQTTLLLFLSMFGLVAFAVAMHVLALSAEQLSTRANQLSVFQVGTRAGMLFAGLVGAIAITAEIRYGTIRPTFLVTPRRGPVIAAKLAVSGLVGIVFGVLAELLMTGAAIVGFAARGIDNELTGGDYLQLLTGGAVAAALWAAAGVGVGALIRNQVGAVVALCAWMFVVESVSEGFVPGAARLMPGGTGLALAGNSDELSAAVGALLLVLYAVAFAAAGWLSTVRRDIA
jgi:ABC-2 type transport system permease protein